MLQAFPNLTGAQAVAILEQTADNKGIYANSAVYGFGLIDLQTAFAPVGTLSVPQLSGQSIVAGAGGRRQVAQSFGDAFLRTQALDTVGYDKFDRLYEINLGEGFRAAPRHSIKSAIPTNQHSAQLVLNNGPTRLSFTTDSEPDAGPSVRGRDDLRQVQTPRGDLSIEADIGRLSFQAWTGQGGLAPAPGLGASENAFAALAQPDHALRAAYSFGQAWSISAEMGGGSPYTLYGISDLAPSRYDMATARFARGRFAAEVSAGDLIEPEGPLGSFLPRGSAFALPAQTSFATARLEWAATDRLWLSAEAGVGRTHAQGEFLTLNDDTVSDPVEPDRAHSLRADKPGVPAHRRRGRSAGADRRRDLQRLPAQRAGPIPRPADLFGASVQRQSVRPRARHAPGPRPRAGPRRRARSDGAGRAR